MGEFTSSLDVRLFAPAGAGKGHAAPRVGKMLRQSNYLPAFLVLASDEFSFSLQISPCRWLALGAPP